jgi:hypothetical protein
VTERIVDAFEPIEVQDQEGGAPVVAPPADHRVELIGELRSAAQAGQRVVCGPVDKLRLQGFELVRPVVGESGDQRQAQQQQQGGQRCDRDREAELPHRLGFEGARNDRHDPDERAEQRQTREHHGAGRAEPGLAALALLKR